MLNFSNEFGLHHNICLPKLCLIGPDGKFNGTMCSKKYEESLSVIDVDTNVSDIDLEFESNDDITLK